MADEVKISTRIEGAEESAAKADKVRDSLRGVGDAAKDAGSDLDGLGTESAAAEVPLSGVGDAGRDAATGLDATADAAGRAKAATDGSATAHRDLKDSIQSARVVADSYIETQIEAAERITGTKLSVDAQRDALERIRAELEQQRAAYTAAGATGGESMKFIEGAVAAVDARLQALGGSASSGFAQVDRAALNTRGALAALEAKVASGSAIETEQIQRVVFAQSQLDRAIHETGLTVQELPAQFQASYARITTQTQAARVAALDYQRSVAGIRAEMGAAGKATNTLSSITTSAFGAITLKAGLAFLAIREGLAIVRAGWKLTGEDGKEFGRVLDEMGISVDVLGDKIKVLARDRFESLGIAIRLAGAVFRNDLEDQKKIREEFAEHFDQMTENTKAALTKGGDAWREYQQTARDAAVGISEAARKVADDTKAAATVIGEATADIISAVVDESIKIKEARDSEILTIETLIEALDNLATARAADSEQMRALIDRVNALAASKKGLSDNERLVIDAIRERLAAGEELDEATRAALEQELQWIEKTRAAGTATKEAGEATETAAGKLTTYKDAAERVHITNVKAKDSTKEAGDAATEAGDKVKDAAADMQVAAEGGVRAVREEGKRLRIEMSGIAEDAPKAATGLENIQKAAEAFDFTTSTQNAQLFGIALQFMADQSERAVAGIEKLNALDAAAGGTETGGGADSNRPF